MDPPADAFLFINKSTTSRTLSRSKAREKAEIFRHVQRGRQKHDGRSTAPASRVNVPTRTFTACWPLKVGDPEASLDDDERRTRSEDLISKITRDTAALAVFSGRDSSVQRLLGGGLDPFDAFPTMAKYLPPATGNRLCPVELARDHLFEYMESLDLSEHARKERLFHALTRPTVMFSHLVMVVIEKETADKQLGMQFDSIYGAGALRHVRNEVQNVQDDCPWDLIALVSIFMFRAQAAGHWDVAKAHQGGLIAMIEHKGGLQAFAAFNNMAQASANGLIMSELIYSAITGGPLHPVLGDTAAGGDFSKDKTDKKDRVLISPFHCADGNFSRLSDSPLSRPETIRLLEAMWLLLRSAIHDDVPPVPSPNYVRMYYRAREQISRSPEIGPLVGMRDYIYECCRITATMLLNSVKTHLPLGSCIENRPLVDQLERPLRLAPSSASWGVFREVYFNIVLVGTVASVGMSSNPYFMGLVRPASGYYVCGVWEGGYRPLVTLKRFQDFCRTRSDPSNTGNSLNSQALG